LEPIKSVAQCVISKELARAASSEAHALIARQLSQAVATSTDLEFFNLILASISPTSSAGGDVKGVRSDLTTALDALSTGADSKIFFVVSSSTAKRLSVMGDTVGGSAFPDMSPSGGSIGNTPTLVSDGLPSNYLVALDASQIAVGAEPGMNLSTSEQALVAADSSPDSPPVAGTVMTSLWQSDLIAIMTERFWGAERLRTTAVAAISNFAPSGNSPA
jgi:hypothetical protein